MERVDGTDTSVATDGGSSSVQRSYEYYRDILTDCDLPCAFVDLDRLQANASSIRERANGTQVRVASKSVRSRAVLDRILDADETFQGLMCYSGREASYLADYGFDDLLLAYPIWQDSDIQAVCDTLAAGANIQVMVDSSEHVQRLASVADEYDTTIPLCLDIDLSTTHFGIHFGVYRSGIQSPEKALAVCETIADTSGVRLDGVMGYEAQLAGIPDDSPANSSLYNAVIRFLKRRSRPVVRDRRVSIVRALEDAGYDLELVNGGGTGTVEFTIQDPTVTEVTVGSGFYAPALFDYYRRFSHLPAAGFAIEVVRKPQDGVYTCRGGGYIASGPPASDREPVPWFPSDIELRDEEGAGEVQTPVLSDGSNALSVGDPVFFRHAKAGELCEQFETLHLLADGEIVETVPTYRGDGRCFL